MDHGKLPYSVAHFEEMNLESTSNSENDSTKMESPRTEIPLHATHETTLTTPNSIPSNVPTSYMRLDTKSMGRNPESDLPSVDNVIKTKRLNTSCLPSIVEEATTPQASSTNLPASSGKAQPSKLAERAKKDLKSVGQWEKVSISPLSNHVKSWITVDGELVLSKNGQPLQQPEEPEAVDHSLKESESLGSAVGVTGPEKIDGTNFSDNIVSDQSRPLPEPTAHSPRHSSKKEDKNSLTSSDFRSQGPTTALTGSELISQLETILKETGKIKVVKPIKFKDAVGRKFSFPWELACTWAVSVHLMR